MTWDDNTRTSLNIFLNLIFPALVVLGVLSYSEIQLVTIQGLITAGVTLLFRIFRTGQQAPA